MTTRPKMKDALGRLDIMEETIGAWIRSGDGKTSTIKAEYLVNAENLIKETISILEESSSAATDVNLLEGPSALTKVHPQKLPPVKIAGMPDAIDDLEK